MIKGKSIKRKLNRKMAMIDYNLLDRIIEDKVVEVLNRSREEVEDLNEYIG